MKIVVLAVAIFSICVLTVVSQDIQATPESRHIVISNKKYEPIKEIYIGDRVKLILTTSKRLKGYVTSIDSKYFMVDSSSVPFHEVERISTKKGWVKILGVPFVAYGGILTVGGLVNIGDIADDGLVGGALLLGIPITAAGVGIMRPGYHKIGRSKWLQVVTVLQ